MKSTFMQAYSQSMMNTSVARLPYVIAKPVDISTYIENAPAESSENCSGNLMLNSRFAVGNHYIKNQ